MIVTLLSDFGTAGEWVAALKGVIRGIAPAVELMDIAHDIPPYELPKAALVLAGAVTYLRVSVHLAVVDPGVGTARKAVALRVQRGDFLVGPDNGLLLPAAARLGGIEQAVALENREYMLEPVHPTFHGRDIFASAAAHLASGLALEVLGPSLDPADLVPAPYEAAQAGSDALYCRVIDVDRFGSLRLNASWDQWEESGLAGADLLAVDIDDTIYKCTKRDTFGESSEGLFLYHDSSGQVGIAANLARANELTGACPGSAVFIYRA